MGAEATRAETEESLPFSPGDGDGTFVESKASRAYASASELYRYCSVPLRAGARGLEKASNFLRRLHRVPIFRGIAERAAVPRLFMTR